MLLVSVFNRITQLGVRDVRMDILQNTKVTDCYSVCEIYKSNQGNEKLTYLLTPRSRVLIEKLTGSQPDKKFPAFYGTQTFITTFTSTCHLSIS